MPATTAERVDRRPGPRAVNRKVDASITDSTIPMTKRLFDRAQQRDPQHLRRWIVLVDGNNHQIDRIRSEAHAHGVRINLIVDFIHVLEYIWDAAADLHPTQPGRAGFVARTARRRSHTPPARRHHERRLQRLLEVPPPARTPTHPYQPLPAPIRPAA